MMIEKINFLRFRYLHVSETNFIFLKMLSRCCTVLGRSVPCSPSVHACIMYIQDEDEYGKSSSIRMI